MSRRGPPPKPTAMRLLQGVAGHHRPVNRDEPKPPVGLPECPDWLSPKAKAVWEKVTPKLAQMRVLTTADADALTNYVVTYARWQAAEEWIATHGEVYPMKDERGNVRCLVPFPQVAIARGLLQILRGYQQEFGLTPAARSRVSALPLAAAGYGELTAFEKYLAGVPQRPFVKP